MTLIFLCYSYNLNSTNYFIIPLLFIPEQQHQPSFWFSFFNLCIPLIGVALFSVNTGIMYHLQKVHKINIIKKFSTFLLKATFRAHKVRYLLVESMRWLEKTPNQNQFTITKRSKKNNTRT
jgi:hypothetical protein